MADEPSQPQSPRERSPLVVPRGAGSTILRALALGPKNVSELVAATGLSQPNVSNHLARLRERGLVRSRRQGRQIIYEVTTASLAHFVLTQAGPEEPDGPAADEVAREFLEAVLTFREEAVVRVADAALAAGMSWKDLYLSVFSPALVRVGELWEEGKLSVGAEHLITGITMRLVHRLSMNLPVSPTADAPSAVVGCVESELHTLGGRMAADFLLAEGWRVWYLNGFLPLEHLMEAVQRHQPDAVVLCLSTEEREPELHRSIQRLQDWRGERILPLLVGGGRYFDGRESVAGLDLQGTDLRVVTEMMEARVSAIQHRLRPESRADGSR